MGLQGPGAIDAAALERRLLLRLVPPLFLVSLLCQLDRSNLAFAALGMDAQLGFSRTVHGLGSGLFFVGYLAQIPASMACLALGPRRWLPMLLVAWGSVAACFAAVQGIRSFLALRLLLGVAEAGAYPAIYSWLQRFFTPRQLGPAFTWVTTATAAAGLLGAPLAAGLLVLDGVGGLAGWRWLFLIEGLLPLLLAVALPLMLPASPETAGFLTPAERQWVGQHVRGEAAIELPVVQSPTAAAAAAAAGRPDDGEPEAATEATDRLPLLDRAQPGGPAPASTQQEHPKQLGACSMQQQQQGGTGGGLSRAALRAGLLDGRVYHLAAAMLLLDAVMNAANFWIPLMVRAVLTGQFASGSGRAPAAPHSAAALGIRAALLSAVPFCAAAVAMVANAHHARLKDERRLHTALPMAGAALALGATPALARAGPAAALLGLSAACSCVWAVHGPFFSWPAALLDPASAALAFALIKTGGAVGGFAGPLAVGALADALGGFDGAMLLLGGVALGCSALVAVFNESGGRRQEAR